MTSPDQYGTTPGHGGAPAFEGAPGHGAAPAFGTRPPAFGTQPPDFGATPPPGFGAPPQGFGAPPPGFGTAPPPAQWHGQQPGYPPQPGWGPPMFAPVAEYTTPGGRELAPAKDRFFARLIDVLIINVPVLLIELPLAIWLYVWFLGKIDSDAFATPTPDVPAEEPPPPPVSGEDLLTFIGLLFALVVVMTLLSATVTYLYEVVYMHRRGQTLGKKFLKIRVVRVEDGGPIEVRHARRRWMAQDGMVLLTLIPLVGSAVGIYNWVDSLWLLWDKPNRQCLHDKYGKTAVVKLTPADLEAAA